MSENNDLRELLKLSIEIRKMSEIVRDSAKDSDNIISSIDKKINTARIMAERSNPNARKDNMMRRKIYVISFIVIIIVVLSICDVI